MADRQLAAVAMCPDAEGGALISVTFVSGPLIEPLLADPVEQKLQACTPEAVANAVSRIVAATGAVTTSIALLLPVALTWHHKQRFHDAIGTVPGAHAWRTSALSNPALLHFASDFPDSSDESVDILFLDLSPGHAAATLRSVEADSGQVFYTGPMEAPTMVETDPPVELSPQDVIDKLIDTPTSCTWMINSSSGITRPNLHGIYIFRPGGPCSAISSALQSKFLATPIKWVSLSEISRSAATMIHRETNSPKPEIMCAQPTVLPFQIALANGQLVPIVPRNSFLPLKRTMVATTSEHDQRTATVAFVVGAKPVATVVVVAGLGLRPRGAVRIEVSVEMGHDGAASVCVEEVGLGARATAPLGNIFDGITRDEIEAYLAEHSDDHSPKFDEDGVIGALPA